MGKLYKNYVLLKINNPNKIYAFKCGIFCLFLDEDAKLMSKILGLKLGNLSDSVVKCGFPCSSMEKYMTILHNLKYDVEIIDGKNNSVLNYNACIVNDRINDFLNKICNINTDKLSISEAYELLTDLKTEAKNILLLQDTND